MLTELQVNQLRAAYLGKKIKVKGNKGDEYVGLCSFLGYNPILPSWGFTVTIGRMPISNVDVKSIQLYKK